MRSLLTTLKRGWATMAHDPVLLLGPYVLAGLFWASTLGWLFNIGVYQGVERLLPSLSLLLGACFIVNTVARAWILHTAGRRLGLTSRWILRLPAYLFNECLSVAIRIALTVAPSILAIFMSYWLASRGAPTIAILLQILSFVIGFIMLMVTSALFSYVPAESLFGRKGGWFALLGSCGRYLKDPAATLVLVFVGFMGITLGSALVVLAPPAQCYADLILLDRWKTLTTKKL